jgi:cystathionine beta-synthase
VRLLTALMLTLFSTALACGTVPAELWALTRQAATAQRLDPELLGALIWQESRFCTDAVSPKGALGLGQLMPATALELDVDPLDPVQNLMGAARYLRQQNPHVEVIGADPEGSIYSNATIHPYLVEGVGEDFWPATFDPEVVDRYVTVSDRDSFLTTRRLAAEEGLLVGGSCGLAVHAALQVAREAGDPAAMVAVILPDGGRAYLSKVFNDAWMTQYGFLERSSDRSVGDVLRAKTEAGEIPPFVTVGAHQKVRDAISLLHEHRVSQLPVVSGAGAVVGSVGERGLLKRAIDDPGLMASDMVEVMEPPFPAVSTTDPVREAVELLSGDRQALTVTDAGRPVGIVTRADLLESLAS